MNWKCIIITLVWFVSPFFVSYIVVDDLNNGHRSELTDIIGTVIWIALAVPCNRIYAAWAKEKPWVWK